MQETAAAETAPIHERVPGGQEPPLSRRVIGTAGNLAVRQGGVLLLGAIGAAAITRILGPAPYGEYAAAVATWTLLGAAADFGFSLMLARDLAGHRELHRPMLRSAYEVGMLWSSVLALLVAAVGVLAGPTTERGILLLVLAPSMAFNGLNPARTLFLVMNRTRVMVWIDLVTALVQVAAMVAVAAVGFGPIGVAAVVSVTSIGNSIASAVAAERLLDPERGVTFSRSRLVRGSVPLGVLAVMNKAYLTLDIVILGWLVSSYDVGQYAAASKLLTILTTVTALVMTAALPALSQVEARADLEQLLARIWHWLMVCALPVFVGAAVFAPTVIRLSVGTRYESATGLLRILALAGAISIISNFVGVLMVSARLTRALLTQTAGAVILNVVGNLLLIPAIGVSAAAWMTAATEVFVCGCALWSLRDHVSFVKCFVVSARPVLAILPAAGVALLLRNAPAAGIPAFALVLLAATSLLRAWPEELVIRLTRPQRTNSASAPVSVEILIVSYNTADLLSACLESIADHLPPPDAVRVSISVLDNASSDGSPDRTKERFPHVQLVESAENVGFARANNRLASEATADFLMLLNSDTRMSEDIITPLLSALQAYPDVRLAAPRLVYPDGQPQFSSERFPTLGFELARELRGTKLGLPFERRIESLLSHSRRRDEIEGRVTHTADFLWATCWMLRREDVDLHGLFDEHFVTYDEDLDYCRRLRRRKSRAVYVASAELIHIGGASSSSEAKHNMVRSARQRYYNRHEGVLTAGSYRLLITVVRRIKSRSRGGADQSRLLRQKSSPGAIAVPEQAPPTRATGGSRDGY